MRLIDADALKEYIDCGHLRPPTELCFSEIDVIRMLDKQPTVDAEPVRHAHWEWCETWLDESPDYPCELLEEGWACSACGFYLMQYLKSHFHDIESYAECISVEMPTVERCPHCGSKMKGSEQDEAD